MKKGFTLIELLAVIVILAVISLIAVPRIMDAIDESRAGALRQNNEAVIKAVQNYFVDNAVDLPQTIGETAEISLEQLIQNDLINEISSPYSSNNCSGYVLVTKVEDRHEFIPHINCFESINSSSEDALALHYTFNHDIENTINFANNNHTNIPSIGVIPNNFIDDERGSVLNLDNSTTFIRANGPIASTNEVSISFWVKPNTSIGYLVNQYQSTGTSYGVRILSGNNVSIFNDTTGVSNNTHFPTQIEGYQWHHVVAGHNEDGWFMYVNGERAGYGLISGEGPSSVGGNIIIGQRGNNTSFYGGKLDDVRIYNRALSTDEIKQIYYQTR